jgi:hypothetical protein
MIYIYYKLEDLLLYVNIFFKRININIPQETIIDIDAQYMGIGIIIL